MKEDHTELINSIKPNNKVDEWAKTLFQTHYIFYEKKGNHARCICSQCGGEYKLRTKGTGDPFEDNFIDIENPQYDAETHCRICKNKARYRWMHKFASEYHYNYLAAGQKITDDKFLFRWYYSYQKINAGRIETHECHEEKRILLIKGQKPIRFQYAHYRNSWTYTGCGENQGYRIYPKTKKEIAKTGMFKYVPEARGEIKSQYFGESFYMDYYIAAARYPDMEMILKAGLNDIARALVFKFPINFNPRGKEIHDRLRINKNRLKPLVDAKGDRRALAIYQLERKLGKVWNEEELQIIRTMEDCEYSKNWQRVLKYASPIRIRNYMEKQKIYYGDHRDGYERRNIRHEYYDYIEMREASGYDMSNDVILFPKDIRRRHNEMVLEREKEQLDKRVDEVNAKYTQIGKKYNYLKKKYSYKSGEYLIRPAKNAGEIVMEGRLLHHCVGRDNYLSSHNTGRSFILFMRKINNPDDPLITIEIKENEIHQWYGEYDKKTTKEFKQKDISKYLKIYTERLKKRWQKTKEGHKTTKQTNDKKTA